MNREFVSTSVCNLTVIAVLHTELLPIKLNNYHCCSSSLKFPCSLSQKLNLSDVTNLYNINISLRGSLLQATDITRNTLLLSNSIRVMPSETPIKRPEISTSQSALELVFNQPTSARVGFQRANERSSWFDSRPISTLRVSRDYGIVICLANG